MNIDPISLHNYRVLYANSAGGMVKRAKEAERKRREDEAAELVRLQLERERGTAVDIRPSPPKKKSVKRHTLTGKNEYLMAGLKVYLRSILRGNTNGEVRRMGEEWMKGRAEYKGQVLPKCRAMMGIVSSLRKPKRAK